MRGFGNGTVILLSLKRQLIFLQVNVSIFGNIFLFLPKKKMHYFQTRFLEEAVVFISQLDPKTAKKILYNIDHGKDRN